MNGLEKFTKDGIFEVKSSLPFVNYVVVKTYGSIQMKRAMETMDDIEQQVEEWDEDFENKCSFTKGIKYLTAKEKKMVEDTYRNYYYLFDENGVIFKEGYSADLARELDCSPKTICNAANDKNRLLRLQDSNGKFNRFSVEKTHKLIPVQG